MKCDRPATLLLTPMLPLPSPLPLLLLLALPLAVAAGTSLR
jgi:hypothetical protein